MKQTDLYLKPEAYFSHGLGVQQRRQREQGQVLGGEGEAERHADEQDAGG